MITHCDDVICVYHKDDICTCDDLLVSNRRCESFMTSDEFDKMRR